MFVPAIGYLQDGGVGKHNNPVDPAQWESKVVWNVEPDLIVSMGTGFARRPNSPIVPRTVPRTMRIFRDGYVPRLFRSFMASLSGQNNWIDHWNWLNDRARSNNFRLDLSLEKEPDLDEVDCMDELRKTVRHHLNTHDDTPGVARALWSSSFFLELDGKPVPQRGWYECRGSIRCRSPDSRALVGLLAGKFPSARFVTNLDTTLGHLNEGDLCGGCGSYRKAVRFHVYHPEQTVVISLRLNQLYSRKISGFPHPMSWFVQQQRLDVEFGRPDHCSPDQPVCRKCNCVSRPKRRSPVDTEKELYKRRRINVIG
jgi:hypothetical protein